MSTISGAKSPPGLIARIPTDDSLPRWRAWVATHPVGGSITISVESESESGFIIAVKDSGIGIAEEDLPRVLQPFVQVDSALSRAHNGTGLGLPLVAVMTELHGGKLEITSKIGHGTTVRACFPAARIVGIADIIPAALGQPESFIPDRALDEPLRKHA